MIWNRLYGLAMLIVAIAMVWVAWNYRSATWAAPKWVIITAMVVMVPLLADNGLALMGSGPHAVQTFTDLGPSNNGAKKRLLLVVPGYNGNGWSVTRSLRSAGLTNTDIVSFYPPLAGYDARQVSTALAQEINRWVQANQDRGSTMEINAYVESIGAQQLVEMLRLYGHIHLRRVVMGAAPFDWHYTSFGSLLQATRLLYGGPILTLALRLWHVVELHNAPTSIQVDQVIVEDAHKASMHLTGRMLMDQLHMLLGYQPVRKGELDSKIDQVVYLCGPDEADPLVKTNASALMWSSAFGYAVRFKTVRDGSWAGLHAPSTERPLPVIDALTAA